MIDILIPSFLLSIFGLFNIFGIKQNYLPRQIVFFIIGFTLYFIIKKIGRNFFRINGRFFYWSLIALTVITYIIGFEIKGSRRWLNLYFFNFQGSEFLKIFFILTLSSYLAKKAKSFNKVNVFLTSLLYCLLPFLIIFKQPDLANAIVFVFIYLVMLLFSDLPKKYLFNLIIISLLTLPLGWFFLKPYQKERLASFFNPYYDIQGTSYNMIQAIITIGSGKFFGRGLGLGTQSRLFFLPENHNDFAFSSLVEQFGFVGGFFVIVFFLAIIWSIIKRTIKFYFQKEEEGKESFLYLIGFLSYFIFQTLVNIGMNLGLLPVAGVTLPFISYGGSSIVSLLIGLALLP